jgi:hypothetical protein
VVRAARGADAFVQRKRDSLANTGRWSLYSTVIASILTVIALPVFAQVGTVSVTHPAGITVLQVEDPQVVTYTDTARPPVTHSWQRPGGRFRLLTGPTAPTGGDPTVAGDEDRAIASAWSVSTGPNSIPYPVFTSKLTVSVDGTRYDMHQLAAAAADVTGSNAVHSYFPTACVVGSRDVYLEGRIPLDNTDPALATEFINVQHYFTLIHDTLRVEYIVTNSSSQERQVGIRQVFDGLFGSGTNRDGTEVYLPNGTVINYEKVIPDAETTTIPDTWVTVDNADSPVVFIRGTVAGDDVLDPGLANSSAGKPDLIGWGLFRNVGADAQWDFTPNSVLALDAEDWAYFTRWSEKPLAVGKSRRYVTYFGVGASAADYDSPYGFAAYSPSTLKVQSGDDPTTDEVETYYLTDSQGKSAFTVTAYADNFLPASLLSASVRISLPTGLELDPTTQSLSKSLGTVRRNEDKSVSWTVRASVTRPGPAVIKFTGPQGKVVERKVYIPAVPILTPLTSAKGLEMVAIPYTFANTDAEHVFSTLGSLYPGGANALVRYQPESRTYKYFPDSFVTNIEPGYGYWLLNRNRETVYFPSDAAALNTSDSATINLSENWNQIGNPFVGPVNLSDVRVIDPNGKEWSMKEAIGRGLLLPTLFWYDAAANDYKWKTELSDVRLDPYVGYWVYAMDDISLVVPPPTLFSPAAAPKTTVSAGATEGDGWRIPLVVSGAGKTRTGRVIGASSSATDGIDANDVLAPPSCLADGVSLSACVEQPQTGVRLMQDIRKAATTATQWNLVVDTNAADTPISVSWPDLSSLPADLTAVCEDLTSGERRYMRTTNGMTFRSGDGGGTRTFRITVQQRGSERTLVTSASVSSTAQGVVVSYSLASDSSVDVEIRNISGVPIRQVASGKVATSGANTLVWDGRNSQGSRVPAGRYLCKVTARSPQTGEQHSLVRSFQVSR